MALTLSILGAVASVIGIYGVYWTFTTERKKLFAYEVSRGLAVASASRIGGDYELSVHFKAAGGKEEKIEGAVLQFIRFANLGREAIYKQDNAPGNPLQIVISGGRVLDIAVVDVKRTVNRIELSPPQLSKTGGSANIEFDFLDHQDGGLVRILTAGEAETIDIKGDVIGMPNGIVCTAPERGKSIPFAVGFTLWAIAEIASFGLIAFLFHEVTGSWNHVWLLALPLLGLAIPLICAISIAIVLDEPGSKLRRVNWQRKAYPKFKFPNAAPFESYLFDYPVSLDMPAAGGEVGDRGGRRVVAEKGDAQETV
jgi:hypothetical protein